MTTIPPNVGARYLVKSGVAMDEIGYVKTNNHTLKADNFDKVEITYLSEVIEVESGIETYEISGLTNDSTYYIF